VTKLAKGSLTKLANGSPGRELQLSTNCHPSTPCVAIDRDTPRLQRFRFAFPIFVLYHKGARCVRKFHLIRVSLRCSLIEPLLERFPFLPPLSNIPKASGVCVCSVYFQPNPSLRWNMSRPRVAALSRLWAISSTGSGPQPLLLTYNPSSLALTPRPPPPLHVYVRGYGIGTYVVCTWVCIG
jgi:hypothetical protein